MKFIIASILLLVSVQVNAAIIEVDPSNFAINTEDLTDAFPNVTLTLVGTDFPSNQFVNNFGFGGMFGRGSADGSSTRIFIDPYTLLRAEFDSPVSAVSFLFEGDEFEDQGILRSYNSSGSLLDSVVGLGWLTISSAADDIAYITAADDDTFELGGPTAFLRRFTYDDGNLSTIPAPPALLLFLTGIIGLGIAQRKAAGKEIG